MGVGTPCFPETLLRAGKGQNRSQDLAESFLPTSISGATAQATRWRPRALLKAKRVSGLQKMRKAVLRDTGASRFQVRINFLE